MNWYEIRILFCGKAKANATKIAKGKPFINVVCNCNLLKEKITVTPILKVFRIFSMYVNYLVLDTLITKLNT